MPEELAYPFPAKCPFELPDEFARLRSEAPVAPVLLPTGNTGWLVTRNADIRTVLSDERFSRLPGRAAAMRQQNSGFDFGMSITDPSEHARWRARITRVLNVRHAEALRPAIGTIVEDLLTEIDDRPSPVDIMAALAFPLPLRVLLHLFAVPDDLRDGFHRWAALLRTAGRSMRGLGAAMGMLHETIVELVARRTGGILGACTAVDPDLTDQELVTTGMLLAVAGYETVATQLGNGLLALFLHPGELRRLATGTVPIATAVEEILRYAQSGTGFAGTTYTTTDVVLADTTIPAGAPVLISIDSAGRDEAHVADPESFDLSRGAAGNHLTFGYGHHFCLGAALARTELQECLGRLLARHPTLSCATDPRRIPLAATMFTRYPAELPVNW